MTLPTDLRGRTAVITGAASGFGFEAARLAAEAGMNVAMADVMDEPLAQAAARLADTGAALLPMKTDVRHGAEVDALAAATRARFGVPHVVFNNAGVSSGGLV